MNKKPILFVLIVLIIILAWSPWITKSYAEKKVTESFEKSQKDIADGCGFNCPGCGVTTSNKVSFGYSVSIEYGCGFGPYPPTQEMMGHKTVFISFLGTTH